MKNSKRLQFITIFLLLVVAILVGVIIKSNRNLDSNSASGMKDMDILGKFKLSYSDSWAVTNNGTEGVLLSKENQNILITTVQVNNAVTLDEIVNENNNKLKATNKVLSDTVVRINSIDLRRIEYGSLDETSFPSDGLIAYSLLSDNVYLTMLINFPPNGNPSEAESIVNTFRYN